LARKSALSHKVKDGQLKVIEDITMEAPKTKAFSDILGNLKSNDKKTLMIVSDINKNLYLSSRNLRGAKVVTASEINTYDIMNAASVLVTEGSIEKIESLLS